MRRTFGTATVSALVLLVSSAAGAQSVGDSVQFGRPASHGTAQVQGFGGFTFGDPAPATTFGGSIAIPLTGNLQIIAEGGRLADLKPELLDTLLDFTPVDFSVPAWYGEAGVRFLVDSGSAVTPYGEATAGFARLNPRLNGVNGTTGVLVNTALQFLDRTEPMLGLGGGIVVQGGPIVLDLGYRYKKIMADGTVQSLLNGGDPLDVSQARIGIGVRF